MKVLNSSVKLLVIISTAFLVVGMIILPYFMEDTKGVLWIRLLLIGMYAMGIGMIILSRRRAEKGLARLSNSLQELLDGCTADHKILLDDTMLSKLQHQILRLIHLHQRREEQIGIERNNMASLVADITHQLRTPMANLTMYQQFVMDSQKIADNHNLEQRLNLVQKMESQIEKLNWLTDGLVKVSRMETGLIQIKAEKAVINDTVLTAIRQAYLASEEKDIQITYSEESRITVAHDVKWTTEALYNVIDNGVKYSPSGTNIHIHIRAYEMFLRIDMRDEGVGIKEEDINHIFKRFYRGYHHAQIEGVGIGLYLTRQIIEAQGGYIKVKSDLNIGSTFSIFLPL